MIVFLREETDDWSIPINDVNGKAGSVSRYPNGDRPDLGLFCYYLRRESHNWGYPSPVQDGLMLTAHEESIVGI